MKNLFQLAGIFALVGWSPSYWEPGGLLSFRGVLPFVNLVPE